VRVLALLLYGASALLALAVAFPFSKDAPVELGAALVPVALAMATGTWLWGDRVPSWVLLAEVVVGAVLNSVLVAFAATTGGAMGDALAYAWLTVYVGLFFPEAAVGFAALVAAGFGLGLIAADLPRMFTGWALVSVTILTLALALRRVAHVVRWNVNTDPLTGALNRTGLEALVQRIGPRNRRRDAYVVGAIDLDGFKGVNDRDGHRAGDRLLADATAAWREALRPEDALARTGGDEFVLLMPNTTEDEAAAVLDRLRRAHEVTWSAGVARWEPDEAFDECLDRADRDLYAAKAARPNG
jgi:diguanylate cyclase (GGDEF)-like protein